MNIRILFLTLLLPAFAGSDVMGSERSGYVFENVRVLSQAEPPVVENARVVVTGDRITSIERAGAELPAGYEVIDGQGKTLMPGLADMHVHYWREDFGPLFLANGITTVRNLWGTQQSIRLDESASRQVFPGPHVYTSGPLMDGPEPIWGDDSIVLTDPLQAIGAVESQKKSGYTAIKLYEGLTPDIYRAAVKAAKEREMQVWTHTPHGLTVLDLVDLEVDSLEHFNNVEDLVHADSPSGDWFELWAAADEKKMNDLARRFADSTVWNTPTLAVIAGRYLYGSDAEAFFDRPEAMALPEELKKWWRESAGRMKPYGKLQQQARASQLRFLKLLHDAGAPLLLGTDTPNPFVLPGYSIHDELAAYVEAGIPIDAVLRIATADAARFLGEEGQWGVVASGARADLILLNGNPIEDLDVLRAPAGVMMNGAWRDSSELTQ